MTEVFNYDFFQIPTTGLSGDQGSAVGAQNKPFTLRLSNFEAILYGDASSQDRTKRTHSDAAFVENPEVPNFAMGGDYITNPLKVGSSLKREYDDELTLLGVGNRRSNTATDLPNADVMDKHATIDDGTHAPRKFPTEGWRTFGGRTGGPEAYTA